MYINDAKHVWTVGRLRGSQSHLSIVLTGLFSLPLTQIIAHSAHAIFVSSSLLQRNLFPFSRTLFNNSNVHIHKYIIYICIYFYCTALQTLKPPPRRARAWPIILFTPHCLNVSYQYIAPARRPHP